MFFRHLNSWIVRVILIITLLFGMLGASTARAASRTIFVKWNAVGANNGSSWANAFISLQSALTIAASGDEVWVAAGTYRPASALSRTISFALKSGVAIYGGFSGVETARDQRDPAANLTVLSGDIDNNDSQKPIITDLKTVTGNTANSYHVVTGATGATLDGFTITAGNANNAGSFPYNVGGGLYNNAASPTLININFTGNSASNSGGGLRNDSSSPTLQNVVFSGNSAAFGGGMVNVSSSPSLTNVTFNGNWTPVDGNGGGMENVSNSSPTLTNVVFNNNWADYGGGMMNRNGSHPILLDVAFTNNSAGLQGGGMNNAFTASPTLTNVTFSGNTAQYGGGMRNFSNSNPILTNVTFSGNLATSSGGGIENNSNNSPSLLNVTFHGNSSTNGGAIYNYASNPQIQNTIFWGNTASGSGMQVYNNTSTPGINNSVLEGGCPAGSTCTNIITSDPMLGILGNYGGNTQTISLLPGSSAIDTGNSANCPATDQRGVARPQGSLCDIGAFEYQEYLSPGSTVRVSINSSGEQTNGYSGTPVISGDGRYIAFTSFASNLVPNDTNEVEDIFVYDVWMGITARISVGVGGVQANAGSTNPSISANGRYIAFASLATNLVPDNNNRRDIFVHDLQTSQTSRVSVDSNGAELNLESNYPSISADGRYVAFETYGGQILIHDIQTGTTATASAASDGTPANRESYHPSLSADGSYMTFASPATNLVPDDTNDRQDIFVRNLQTGVTTRASLAWGDVQADESSGSPSISANGRYVVFISYATNLVPNDTNYQADAFVRDLQTGMISRVSIDSYEAQANGQSEAPSISADGRYVAFLSRATNLVPADTNGTPDIFVHDTQTGMTTRVSVDSNGAQSNNMWSPWTASLSSDGQYIAFDSDATNLVAGDTNNEQDIFVHRQGALPPPATPTPTNPPTATPTDTPTSTPTFTPTNTPTYTPTETPTFTPTSTTTFTPTSTATFTPTNTPTNTSTPTATPAYSYHPLYLSLTDNQTIGGISSADEDILKFDGQNWSLFFDGSDVGVGGSDLFAFSLVDPDSFLLAFTSSVTVNGITATTQDILRFDATSLGSTTAGTFSMYFDGSDVGFDVSSESIDALALLPDGRLLLSPTGNASVTGVSGTDEDILAFTPTSLGNTTAGTWTLYFDGSDVGLADSSTEDVDAADVGPNGNIYLSTLGDFAVIGVSGADEDIFVCVPTSIGSTTACSYATTLYFDGSTWGLAGNDVDAFNFLAMGPTPTPGPTNTPTQIPTSTPTFTPTATSEVTSTPTPPAGDMIFADGFEAGTLSAWSSSATDAGDLSVTPAAALEGSQGLQAVIDDANVLSVTSEQPAAEPRYRARFRFDPNSIGMANNNAHIILRGYSGSSTVALRLEFGYSGGVYQVRAGLVNDGTTWTETSWITLSDAPHTIELDWRAATAAGANNGGLTMWLDGVQQADIAGIDNDTRRMDRVLLGALAGVDTGTSGTYFFDAFESRRQTYIGP